MVAMAGLEERPSTKRWTADEVWTMVEVGLLTDDDRYELIDGELLEVSPRGEGHARAVALLHELMVLVYAPLGFRVRGRSPVGGIHDWIPEPDLAVTRPLSRGQRTAPRPDQTVLLVEVAMTSHARDRRKTRVYAQSGAREFWLVDLVRGEVVVHRRPLASGDWGEVSIARAGERVPLPEADGWVEVDAILEAMPEE